MIIFKNLKKFGKPGKKFEKTSGNPVNCITSGLPLTQDI